MASIAGLGDMAISPTSQTPAVPGLSGAAPNNTGSGAQQGLSSLSQGSQDFTQAVDQASQALDTLNAGSSTNITGMKKGGKVKSKSTGKDWHGFGIGSSIGKNKHGF
jgi:hypothetical protein